MTLSKFGYAAAFLASVAGFAPANDFSPISSAYAASSQGPALAVGCRPKSELQSVIFNDQDQSTANSGREVIGKIGVKDQFYSVTAQGKYTVPVKTTIAVDYNGKNYGHYAYIIESKPGSADSCVTNIFLAQNLGGESKLPSLHFANASVVAEGASISNSRQMISILMRDSNGAGNTFVTNMPSGSPVAVMSHGRDVPSSYTTLASLTKN